MKTGIITKILLFLPRKIFIAGKTQKEVLDVVARLNGEGFLATIDILGEHSKSEEEVEKALAEYKQLVNEIQKRGLQATISIKLTHLGLEFGFGYCFNIVKELVVHARQNQVCIEFDAEEYKFRSNTIEVFRSLSKPENANRLCLQANILKSWSDLTILHGFGFQTRIVRGAYEESSDVALYDQKQIEGSFLLMIETAVSEMVSDKQSKISGPKHAIATRDKKIIDWAKKLIEANPSLNRNCIEFQLLYGYLALGRQLLREGYPVRIYLPYGDDQAAFPYILRRLKTPHAWRLLFDWLFNLGKTR